MYQVVHVTVNVLPVVAGSINTMVLKSNGFKSENLADEPRAAAMRRRPQSNLRPEYISHAGQ